MLKTKINLKTPVVESREQRLGTVVSWSGSASDLVRQSGYSGGCGECTLCEMRTPFSQGSVCSEQMVECQAGQVRDAVLIQHSPIGCAAGQVSYNSLYRNGLKMRGFPVEGTKVLCTNLTEKDMVFGGIDKLRQSVDDAWERFHPKAIFISTSCATAIIGDDIDSVATEYSDKLGIPVVPMHCEGFRSKHWSTGFDSTQHGILRQIARKGGVKQEDLVNVISLWGSDIFTPMFKELNLRVNYVVDLSSVADLAQLSEAVATVSFCNTLSTYLASGLEQDFGVPQVKAPQPYGFAGTDAWLRELGRVTHREDLVEKYIARKHAEVEPKVAALRKKLKGLRGMSATGSAYSHGLVSVIRELGVESDATMVFHHDPVYDSHDPRQDSLNELVKNYGDVKSFNVSNRQQYQFYILLKKYEPDFILIRHNGLAPLASRMGIPAVPLGDEHQAVGYDGMVNIGNIILDVLAHKKFHLNLAAHVHLPYTQWWLRQDDPYILAKHPELLDKFNLKGK